MGTAEWIALWGCGLFFLTGLLTGVWKYGQILKSPKAKAHYYVDVAHRASLMYAFACLVLERFAQLSQWPEWVDVAAVVASLVFFALSVGSYILHGFRQDTRNQLRKPGPFVHGFMVALVVAEIGGFTVLLAGFALAG